MKKLLAVLAIAGISVISWYQYSIRPVDADDKMLRSVTILSGLSVSDIGWLLKNKGIIRSAPAFSLYARWHGAEASLQAGDFLLNPGMNVAEIVLSLKRGLSEESAITIPEGFTVKDIDQLLSKKELIKAGDFLRCAAACDFSAYEFLSGEKVGAFKGGLVEGYLFPDTYFVVAEEFTAKNFIERLLTTFRERVIVGLGPELEQAGRTLHEIVTMASLIEEETRTGAERPIVSGILWKRFDAGQGLGADAAIRYALEKPTAEITVKDLDADSPYNLRKFRGLPPGPIANPGLASIKAALHPEDSKYWYYLHGKDGVIRYAETNEGHNRNKALYLQ
ncbi:endolytic transglycosylase MltG [Candidatus Peregrinibacteria bacterium]|nr:endolytic transglycosylase MltG [Candidatus Peregrinibacteria bacterium]